MKKIIYCALFILSTFNLAFAEMWDCSVRTYFEFTGREVTYEKNYGYEEAFFISIDRQSKISRASDPFLFYKTLSGKTRLAAKDELVKKCSKEVADRLDYAFSRFKFNAGPVYSISYTADSMNDAVQRNKLREIGLNQFLQSSAVFKKDNRYWLKEFIKLKNSNTNPVNFVDSYKSKDILMQNKNFCYEIIQAKAKCERHLD